MNRKDATLKQYNPIGKRLRFIRSNLNLTLKEVQDKTNIRFQTIHNMENNCRTTVYEYFLVLSSYYDSLWQERFFPNQFPKIQSTQIKTITPTWIMFGKDLHLENLSYTINLLQENYEDEKQSLLKVYGQKAQNKT